MSQKTSRRGRRQTQDQEESQLSLKPRSKENGDNPAGEDIHPPPLAETPTNGHPVEKNGTETEAIVTRSRSATPQQKQLLLSQPTNGNSSSQETGPEAEAEAETIDDGDHILLPMDDGASSEEVPLTQQDPHVNGSLAGKDDLDPLIASDDLCPELDFQEENSDAESVPSSPLRCKTRRSDIRNTPTPKTPHPKELDESLDFCSGDDASTKAEAGSDSTRLEYMEKNLSVLEGNSFIAATKDKSFGESLRLLSTRRSLRPFRADYRKRALTNNRSELDGSYGRGSIERIMGVKRRGSTESSATDENSGKRFKSDSPGFFARLTSPLGSLRNPFRSDLVASTPKLTGYKDDNLLIGDEGDVTGTVQGNEGENLEKRWCSIM